MCDAKISEMVNSPFKFPWENLTDITDKRKKKGEKEKLAKKQKNIEKYLSDCCLIWQIHSREKKIICVKNLVKVALMSYI